MSEFELGILRQRAQEAYRQKVLRGEVLTKVPTGYVRSEPSGIEVTPDREVQEAIRGVFLHFGRLGTLRQVLLWYHRERISLPLTRVRDGIDTTVWQLPNYQQLLRILKNPTYAGAFAYGRTKSRLQVADGRSHKTGGHRVAMEDWQVLLKDHHAAYISWEQYVENQRILTSNRTKSHPISCGAAKTGSALLSGLFRCARCGHKLHVAYRGREGRAPRYYCMTGNSEQGKPSCLCFGAVRIEQAVVNTMLEACAPIGIAASLAAADAGDAERAQKRRTFDLALERARYEANRVRQQYDAVDPSNRLVAAELEARWNAALTRVAETEARLQSELETSLTLTAAQRERLMSLGTDLQSAWNDPVAPVTLKKRILRTVINEIVVDVNHASQNVEMRIHWAGGVHTELNVRKNKVGRNGSATDQEVVEMVRELAKLQPDSSIAATLNRAGFQTGPGNNWNQTRVKNLRQHHQIPVFVEGCDRPWMTMGEAAAKLGVGVGAIKTMIKQGVLTARQATKGAPWMIERADVTEAEAKNYAHAARSRNAAPENDNNQTLMPII